MAELAVDDQDNVFAVYPNNNEVREFAPGGAATVIAGNGSYGPFVPGPATSSTMNNPNGVAVDAQGNVYIASNGNSGLAKVTPDGTLSVLAGNKGYGSQPTPGPGVDSQLGGPWADAVDRAGNVYVADLGNAHIEKVAPDGILSIFAGNGQWSSPAYGSAPTSSPMIPFGIAVNACDTVYIASTFFQSIDRIGSPVPCAPGRPALTPGDGVAHVTFTAPIDRGTTAITGYEASSDGGLTWTPIATTGTQTLTATIRGLANGVTATVLVRARNNGGEGAPSSDATVTSTGAPVSTGPATISGTDTIGHTLTCSHGTWDVPPTSLHYQWWRDGIIIHGATHEAYTIASSDEGYDLSCEVTARDAKGTAHTTSSSVMVPITAGAACPAPTGSLTATTLGRVALGDRQDRLRSRLARFDRYSYHTDNFCLSAGPGIRVGYASQRLLSEAHMRPTLNNKVVLALTANPYCALDAIRPGTRVSAIARHLRLSTPWRSGRNTWYTIPGRAATGVLKARHGVILEVGTANRTITRHRVAEHQLLQSF